MFHRSQRARDTITEFVPSCICCFCSTKTSGDSISQQTMGWIYRSFEMCGDSLGTGTRTTNHVEGWNNSLHSRFSSCHPSLAELIGLFQISQHISKYRVHALLIDLMALPKPQKPEVILRHQSSLQKEMQQFHTYFITSKTSYQDILNFIDRVSDIGVMSQQL